MSLKTRTLTIVLLKSWGNDSEPKERDNLGQYPLGGFLPGFAMSMRIGHSGNKKSVFETVGSNSTFPPEKGDLE